MDVGLGTKRRQVLSHALVRPLRNCVHSLLHPARPDSASPRTPTRETEIPPLSAETLHRGITTSSTSTSTSTTSSSCSDAHPGFELSSSTHTTGPSLGSNLSSGAAFGPGFGSASPPATFGSGNIQPSGPILALMTKKLGHVLTDIAALEARISDLEASRSAADRARTRLIADVEHFLSNRRGRSGARLSRPPSARSVRSAVSTGSAPAQGAGAGFGARSGMYLPWAWAGGGAGSGTTTPTGTPTGMSTTTTTTTTTTANTTNATTTNATTTASTTTTTTGTMVRRGSAAAAGPETVPETVPECGPDAHTAIALLEADRAALQARARFLHARRARFMSEVLMLDDRACLLNFSVPLGGAGPGAGTSAGAGEDGLGSASKEGSQIGGDGAAPADAAPAATGPIDLGFVFGTWELPPDEDRVTFQVDEVPEGWELAVTDDWSELFLRRVGV